MKKIIRRNRRKEINGSENKKEISNGESERRKKAMK
jgi:hypothetical protein